MFRHLHPLKKRILLWHLYKKRLCPKVTSSMFKCCLAETVVWQEKNQTFFPFSSALPHINKNLNNLRWTLFVLIEAKNLSRFYSQRKKGVMVGELGTIFMFHSKWFKKKMFWGNLLSMCLSLFLPQRSLNAYKRSKCGICLNNQLFMLNTLSFCGTNFKSLGGQRRRFKV